jgi:hypothetical protein
MNDQVKYLAKLSASTAFTMVKLYAAAAASTILSLVLSVHIMITSAPDADGVTSGMGLIAARPWHCVIAILILGGGAVLVILSGKYALGKVMHKLLTDKGEAMIAPFLDKAIGKFRENRPASIGSASSAALSKMRLAQEARNGSGNRWMRGALALAFKQARLDDVDFSKDDTRMGEVVRDRTMLALREMSRPGKALILAVVGAQWFLVLLGWIIR